MTDRTIPHHQSLFVQLDDSSVVVRNQGNYLPLPVYKYEQRAYVKMGAGYVLLRPTGATSRTGAYWDALNIPGHEAEVVGINLLLHKFGSRAAA